MQPSDRAAFAGFGAAAPARVLTNADLEKLVDTTDEWIRTRTGIERRHIAEDGQTTLTFAVEAARRALDDAGVAAEELDLIILGTITPDFGFPATACLVQDAIGAKNAAAVDISAACSGFLYALHFADAAIRSGGAKKVLIVGAETLSRITNWTDRNTCVLFGDAAGAAVVVPSKDSERGVLGTHIGSDGSQAGLLWRAGGGTRPFDNPAEQYITMSGKDVFKRAVTAMGNAAESILEKVGMTGADVNLLIPHQANIRIIEATAKRLDIPLDKVYVNIQDYGNTSAATIPVCLAEAKACGRLKPGDVVLLVAFGGGLTWGSAIVRI